MHRRHKLVNQVTCRQHRPANCLQRRQLNPDTLLQVPRPPPSPVILVTHMLTNLLQPRLLLGSLLVPNPGTLSPRQLPTLSTALLTHMHLSLLLVHTAQCSRQDSLSRTATPTRWDTGTSTLFHNYCVCSNFMKQKNSSLFLVVFAWSNVANTYLLLFIQSSCHAALNTIFIQLERGALFFFYSDPFRSVTFRFWVWV